MINIYIDNLTAPEALNFFQAFVKKEYIVGSECSSNSNGFRDSSVRLEAHDPKIFSDLNGYFNNA